MTGAVQAEEDGPLFSLTSPRFAADLTPTLQADGQTYLQMTLQIPYADLRFVPVPAGFGAAVEVVVILKGKGGKRTGDAWEERFVLRTFEETRAEETMVSVKRRFSVKPGKYDVRIQVSDVTGKQQSEAQGTIRIEGLGGGSLGIAEPIFGKCLADSNGILQFEQNVSRRYVRDLELFCLSCRIYDLQSPSDSIGYQIRYRVGDEGDKTVVEGDTLLMHVADRLFHLQPDVSQLFVGTYELEIEVEQGNRKDKVTADFVMEALTLPRGKKWDQVLEALSFVVSSDQLEPLRAPRTEETRERAWILFWSKLDPEPATEKNEALLEFVRRIRYANSHFRGYSEGWKTDQGRVYIQHGQPDQVEDVSPTERDPPLQIWHFFDLKKQYVFADRDGFGRYVLLNVVGP